MIIIIIILSYCSLPLNHNEKALRYVNIIPERKLKLKLFINLKIRNMKVFKLKRTT